MHRPVQVPHPGQCSGVPCVGMRLPPRNSGIPSGCSMSPQIRVFSLSFNPSFADIFFADKLIDFLNITFSSQNLHVTIKEREGVS